MSGKGLIGAWVILATLGGAAAAVAQEDLNRGKTPPQLFASDCTGAGCHRDARGLTKMSTGALADFLRVHYTASKENAAALAAYVNSLSGERPARPAPRPAPAKPVETDKDKTAAPAAATKDSDDSKPSSLAKPADAAVKPTETKPADSKPSETTPAEAKPGDGKSSETKPPEKPAEPKSAPPPAASP